MVSSLVSHGRVRLQPLPGLGNEGHLDTALWDTVDDQYHVGAHRGTLMVFSEF